MVCAAVGEEGAGQVHSRVELVGGTPLVHVAASSSVPCLVASEETVIWFHCDGHTVLELVVLVGQLLSRVQGEGEFQKKDDQ